VLAPNDQTASFDLTRQIAKFLLYLRRQRHDGVAMIVDSLVHFLPIALLEAAAAGI
jgi:hypothetical protein